MNKNSNQQRHCTFPAMLLQNYTERGVISEYLNIDYIVDPQFVNALLKEKNTKPL